MTDLTRPTITWRCVQPGLWTGYSADNHPVGIITERWGQGFHVTSSTGLDLGLYATLTDAQHALEMNV